MKKRHKIKIIVDFSYKYKSTSHKDVLKEKTEQRALPLNSK